LILLDTHALIWLVAEPQRLSRPAASAIRRARVSDGLGISDISIWELASLFSRGILRSSGTVKSAVDAILAHSSVIVLPITSEIASIACQFPPDYPKDPADRLIGATAMSRQIPLVTRDEKIQSTARFRTVW